MFLDLNLGSGTGFDVLRWMRAERRFVPTAVMTAFRLEFDVDEAIELGALVYVDQPLSLEGLIGLARSLTRPMSPLDDPNHLHARVRAGDPGALECWTPCSSGSCRAGSGERFRAPRRTSWKMPFPPGVWNTQVRRCPDSIPVRAGP